MRNLVLVALIFCADLARATPQDLWIVGGRMFDAVGTEARENPGVWVRAGKILGLGSIPKDVRERATELRLEATEVLLPGFIDLHAHHGIDLFGRGRRDETRSYPSIFLANGVTSVYPAGEVNPDEMGAMHRRIGNGEQIGPRVFRSGPYFGSWRKGWDRNLGLDELRAEVDAWAASGVTCFKAKGIGPAHLEVLIDQAHSHGLTVTGHLGSGFRGSVNPRDAIRMGIDRVEHFLGGDQMSKEQSAYASLEALDPTEPAFADIVKLFIEHHVYFDATLSAFGYFGKQDPEVFTTWADERAFFTPFVRDFLKDRAARPPILQFERIYWKKRTTLLRFYELGGGPFLTVGTDHPSWGDYLSGFAFHRELHCLSLAGLPNHAVLRAATINGARALGAGDRLGSIEVGKWADLVVVSGDPLVDIRATRKVIQVIKAGRVYDPQTLLDGARDQIGPVDAGGLSDW